MTRFFEFVQHHALLVTAAVALAVIGLIVELRHRARSATAVSPADAVRLINSNALVIDVRPAEAFAASHIIDARHIPQAEIASQTDALKKYREKALIIACDNGAASAAAATALKALGFSKVVNIRGGLEAWKQENLPLVSGGSKGKKTKT